MAVDTLTDVPGLRVGHAVVPGGGSGCTVVLGPFRGAVEVTGPATGSRELGTLARLHMVPRANAILLTGGSAYGLAAADGVMAWLEARGEGHPTGAGPVPIVPSAVLYDLAVGRARPGPDEGRQACEAASGDPVAMGRVGAGAGATVGKLLGVERGVPGGVGSASMPVDRWRVGALAAVNAVGDVRGRDGAVLAGPRDEDGGLLDATAIYLERLRAGEEPGPPLPPVAENTTLAVVAVDAPATRTDLARIARMASAAVARRLSPPHTPFDGDLTFAVSTSEGAGGVSPRELLGLGMAAAEVLGTAVERSVAPPDPRGDG